MPATEVGDRLIDQIEQAFTEESELPQLIEAGERDDANPWLRRTQWAVYLRGINPQHLIDCVQAPDADSSDPTEMAASAIWDAMAAMARISQLVCTKTSHTIRTEADVRSATDCRTSHCKPTWMPIISRDIRSRGSKS